MKAYFKRLKENCPTRRFVFWWILRGFMIYAFIAGFFKEPFDITDPLQVGANFVGMFMWEIFMLFPEKSMWRRLPSIMQTFLSILIFCASFGGKFMNFYYDIKLWDSILHFVGSGVAVFFGYEIFCALMKRDRKEAPLAVILLASLSFSFFVTTAWELFEFTFDQVAGMMSGYPGDAQHWSLELALGTPKEFSLFDPIVPERWPIMDIMADMVLNFLGALLSFAYIYFIPYRHKGRFKFDFDFSKEKETVNK